jgi:hypothetical protein
MKMEMAVGGLISTMTGSTNFISGSFGFLGQHIVKAVHDYDPHGDLRVLVRTPSRTLMGIGSMSGAQLLSGHLGRPETFTGEMDGVDVVILP